MLVKERNRGSYFLCCGHGRPLPSSRRDLRRWGAYPSVFREKNSPGTKNSRCKDSEQGECLACPRTVSRPWSLEPLDVGKSGRK